MKHVQVFGIENFDSLQKEALSLIPVNTEQVYGDYDVHGDPTQWQPKSKPYYDVTMRMIKKACDTYSSSWGCTTWNLNTLWYHAYNEGGTYRMHTHTLTNMTGVLHLLLEDERDHTNVMNFEGNIKQGEVVLFPSMHPHKSEVVHGIKIIIGFNWDIHHNMKTREAVQ